MSFEIFRAPDGKPQVVLLVGAIQNRAVLGGGTWGLGVLAKTFIQSCLPLHIDTLTAQEEAELAFCFGTRYLKEGPT